MRARLVVVDSVTTLDARHADAVVVTGSHGGLIAARYVAAAAVRGAIFNDAGGGLEGAGVAGLDALASAGVAAAAVSNLSARIGDGADTLANGIVSYVNAPAMMCGVAAGMRCRDAAEAMCNVPSVRGESCALAAPEGRFVLRDAAAGLRTIVAVDSIGLVEPGDAQRILVIGSHGGLHGGDAGSALTVAAYAAFFHDAGRGREDAGTTRLPALARRGIAAGTVDYRTARIGDARSMWMSGVLSCVNAPLERFGVTVGIDVQHAVRLLDAR